MAVPLPREWIIVESFKQNAAFLIEVETDRFLYYLQGSNYFAADP